MSEPQATVLPGLYLLALPTPFPIGRVNVYVAKDDETVTLIDCGVNSDRAYNELVEGLAALDLTPADLDRIILTHHHTDHVGLAARLVEQSGAAVWCHPLCVPHVEHPVETRAHLLAWSQEAWQEAGVPQPIMDLTALIFESFERLTTTPVQVVRTLDDGDTIDLLGMPWTVLHTPGHAGDLICLHQPDDAIMIISDHLIQHVSSNAFTEPPLPGQKRPRRLLQYMDGLRRVADLAPRIAYTGHGDPVTDVPGLVAVRLAFHQKRVEHIEAILAEQPEPLTLYQLAEIIFRHVSEQEKFMALSEVLGHLDWLERDGHIQRETRAGRIHWRVAEPTGAV